MPGSDTVRRLSHASVRTHPVRPDPLEPTLLTLHDLRGPAWPAADALVRLLPRAPAEDARTAREAVQAIIDDVIARGDDAVAAASLRLDHVDHPPAQWRATKQELAAALEDLSPELRRALLVAADRIRSFHEAQVPSEVRWSGAPGVNLELRYVPLDRVGVYVPGGRGAYPSSVLMNVLPAQAAGVGEIALATPPGPGGRGHPVILAAAALLGIEEVWLLGGAQAIAALAVGTRTVPRVAALSGPGNVYVALAKQMVAGRVRIDAVAGPTEIAVIADGDADPRVVAADLVAQAEHDPLAACLLITTDIALWRAVEPELHRQVAATPHAERVRAAFGGQSAVVVVDDVTAALAVSEAWAPEHLELLVADAGDVSRRVRRAGAVFVGPWTPVALGDYAAGTNHVLPTAGTARVASGLSTLHYLRTLQVAHVDEAALAALAPTVAALAEAEDLPAHAHAVSVRLARPGHDATAEPTQAAVSPDRRP